MDGGEVVMLQQKKMSVLRGKATTKLIPVPTVTGHFVVLGTLSSYYFSRPALVWTDTAGNERWHEVDYVGRWGINPGDFDADWIFNLVDITCSDDGVFCAVGVKYRYDSGPGINYGALTSAISNDGGKTWENFPLITNSPEVDTTNFELNVQRVFYGNGKFVAVGFRSSLYNGDGYIPAPAQDTGLAYQNYHNHIYGVYTGLIWSSDDGINWDLVYEDPYEECTEIGPIWTAEPFYFPFTPYEYEITMLAKYFVFNDVIYDATTGLWEAVGGVYAQGAGGFGGQVNTDAAYTGYLNTWGDASGYVHRHWSQLHTATSTDGVSWTRNDTSYADPGVANHGHGNEPGWSVGASPDGIIVLPTSIPRTSWPLQASPALVTTDGTSWTRGSSNFNPSEESYNRVRYVDWADKLIAVSYSGIRSSATPSTDSADWDTTDAGSTHNDLAGRYTDSTGAVSPFLMTVGEESTKRSSDGSTWAFTTYSPGEVDNIIGYYYSSPFYGFQGPYALSATFFPNYVATEQNRPE